MNPKPIRAKKTKVPTVPKPGEKPDPKKNYYQLELYLPPLSVVVLEYNYKDGGKK